METQPSNKREARENVSGPSLTELLDSLLKPERPQLDLDQVTSPEEFLRAVDFGAINDIFDTLVEKSRDETKVSNTGHRVRPDHVFFVSTTGGQQRESDGRAWVNDGIIELMWEQDAGKPLDRTLFVLSTLMHEATHVRGGYAHENWIRWVDFGDIGEFDAQESMVRAGLEETTYDAESGDQIVKGLSLSEAVTENISHEVMNEYLRRTGNEKYLRDSEYTYPVFNEGAYSLDRIVLGIVIDELASSLQVDEGLIWQGFVAAYMNGNTDLQSLLEDIQRELERTPAIAELVKLMRSNKPLFKTEHTEESVLESLGTTRTWNPFKRRRVQARHDEAIRRVVDPLAAEKFKNVLGLR